MEIKNVTITLNKNGRKLIDGFSFVLGKGDRAAIIGEEGNGKSTLLKALYDADLLQGYASCEGEIIRDSVLGYLPQELPAAYRGLSVYGYFCEVLSDFVQDPGEIARTLSRLSLPGDFFYSDQRMDTLSGGEKVKVQLAAILLSRPDVLLLDEPTNDIDIPTLEWLEGFLLTCGLPLIYVSHDETLIERTANVIIHLEQVRRKTVARHTVSRLPYREYMASRASQMAHQDQVARKEREEHKAQMARWQQLYDKVEYQQRTITRQDPGGARLLKKKMKSLKSAEKRYEKEAEDFTEFSDAEEAILVAFPDSVRVPAGKRVLDFMLPVLTVEGRVLARDVRLQVTGPEHVAIIGKNGAGKTTLLRQIAQSLSQREDVRAAYMPQNYEELLRLDVTPADFLAQSGKKEDVTRARTFLGSMKYTHEEMTGTVAMLSGGQKAKLLFLRMILEGNNVLVLDEPTRNFSPLSAPVIRKVLSAYGGAIISVTHDRKYLSEVCPVVYRLDEKGLVREGK